jgi:hypothetical protein
MATQNYVMSNLPSHRYIIIITIIYIKDKTLNSRSGRLTGNKHQPHLRYHNLKGHNTRYVFRIQTYNIKVTA